MHWRTPAFLNGLAAVLSGVLVSYADRFPADYNSVVVRRHVSVRSMWSE